MKRTLLLASAAMGLLCATATPALAGTTADLLKRLHEKGILSDEEYQELLKNESAEAASAPAARTPRKKGKP